METTAMTYEAALNELKQLSTDIDTGNVSVDVLAEKVKRASVLISFCQAKLRSSEDEVNAIIAQIEK